MLHYSSATRTPEKRHGRRQALLQHCMRARQGLHHVAGYMYMRPHTRLYIQTKVCNGTAVLRGANSEANQGARDTLKE